MESILGCVKISHTLQAFIYTCWQKMFGSMWPSSEFFNTVKIVWCPFHKAKCHLQNNIAEWLPLWSGYSISPYYNVTNKTYSVAYNLKSIKNKSVAYFPYCDI